MVAPSDSLGHRAPAKSNIHLFAWQRRNATECASFACRPLTPDPVLDPQNLNALVVFPVACHHTRSMRQRGRGDHEVGVSHAPPRAFQRRFPSAELKRGRQVQNRQGREELRVAARARWRPISVSPAGRLFAEDLLDGARVRLFGKGRTGSEECGAIFA